MPEIKIDPKVAARRIISDHTAAYISGIHFEPKDATELWEVMVEECAFILTEDFLDGKYTAMQYNAIRNELSDILNGIFNKACDE